MKYIICVFVYGFIWYFSFDLKLENEKKHTIKKQQKESEWKENGRISCKHTGVND